MKIVYCYHSLNHHGGVEKILSIKANYLVQNFGYEVFIITYNQNDEPVFFDLDKRIKIVDLSISEPQHKKYNFIFNKVKYYHYQKKFKDKLTNELVKIKADFSISLGGSEFYVLNSIKVDTSIKLAEYHVTIGAFDVINSGLAGLQKLRANLSFQRFVKNIKNYKRFIVLTKGDQKEWSSKSNNVISIPNPQTFQIAEQSLPLKREKLAVAVGRFEPEKQFDKLIIIWKKTITLYPEWKLILKGSGSQIEFYNKLIKDNSLENNVIIEEPSLSMDEFYKKASIYLMASKFEGFSLVMLEAMQFGLPIVSFNCKYGPSELVQDNDNGFLIDIDNDEDYIEKIILLIENDELRRRMSLKAKKNAKKYEIEKVMNTWKNLFEQLKNDK